MRGQLTAARVARLGTVRPDGTPHIVVCCFALAGEVVVFTGGLEVTNVVQSNLTILTDRHVDFLKSSGFFRGIGVSFDAKSADVSGPGFGRRASVICRFEDMGAPEGRDTIGRYAASIADFTVWSNRTLPR